MTQTARVKLTSISLPKLDGVCNEIMGIGKKTGVKLKDQLHFLLKNYMLQQENLHVVAELKHMKNGR